MGKSGEVRVRKPAQESAFPEGNLLPVNLSFVPRCRSLVNHATQHLTQNIYNPPLPRCGMEAYQIEEFLGSGMEGARRSTLFSLYRRALPMALDEDSARIKTLLFREEVERRLRENAPLYNSEQSLSYQIKHLLKAGYAAAAGVSTKKFEMYFRSLSTVASASPPADSYNFPYILIIPSSLIPLRAQLRGIKAQSFLDPDDFAPAEPTPIQKKPYLIANVSAGEMHKGLSVSEALPLLEATHRFPLSLEETIALLTQTRGEVLHYHNLIAAATRHQNKYVPDLYCAGTDKVAGFSIKLKRELPTNAHPHGGIPSCSGRITLA